MDIKEEKKKEMAEAFSKALANILPFVFAYLFIIILLDRLRKS